MDAAADNFGIVILLRARRRHTVLLLLSVPLYYLLVQSALHTERRYEIAIHYFFTIFPAVFLWMLFGSFKEAIPRSRISRRFSRLVQIKTKSVPLLGVARMIFSGRLMQSRSIC